MARTAGWLMLFPLSFFLAACSVPFTRQLNQNDIRIPEDFLRGSFNLSGSASASLLPQQEREFRRVGPFEITYNTLDRRVRIARAQLRYKICFQASSAFTFSGTLFYRAYMGNAAQALFEPRWLLAEGTLDVSRLNGGQRQCLEECLEGSRDLSPDQVALFPNRVFYLGAAWTGNASSQPPGATVSYEAKEFRFIVSGSVSLF